MSYASEAYKAAERDMNIPPVAERGRTNENPEGIGFWALVAEDFRTHDRKLFEQGFWALFVHRFGNWRMGQPKLIRAPATLIYRILFKLIEWTTGISLWYTVKVGRRVRLWHHSGMIIGNRAIGDDVHLRQNTTLGVAQTWRNDELPIIGSGVDIGAGACIAGAVYVGRDARIGANALVITDVPAGATVMGNPAQIYSAAAEAPAPETSAETPPAPAMAPGSPDPVAQAGAAPAGECPLQEPRDLGTIALLGSANLDYLAMSFTEEATRYGLQVSPQVPPFGQARMALLQDGSDLLQACARGQVATLIAERAEELLGEALIAPLALAEAERDAELAEALAPLYQLLRAARDKLPGPLFVLSLAPVARSSLGLADAQTDRGRAALVARANALLAEEVAAHADTHLIDAAAILAQVGQAEADPGTFWHMGRVPFGTGFAKCLARRVMGAVMSLRGQTARLLVLDLDNTLWGGVLGEDGMEGLDIGGAHPGSAYKAFQNTLKALTQRGIALAVASKNDEDLALQMIAEHPEMVLRPEDIIAHRISWNEKALGIQEMLDEIGLGAANTMFIDDNPVEREKVRKNIPGLIVPGFPASPEQLTDWLLDSPFLECIELTESDLKRTRQYKTRARVTAAKREFTNIEDFYRDLQMQLTFEPYGPANQKRVLQLFAKTNQFNATLRRHDAAALATILREGGEVFAIGVADRHSAYELMGVIVLRDGGAMAAAYPEDPVVQAHAGAGEVWVDSLLLSCRILGRTVEQAIVSWAAERATGAGAGRLVGQIIEAPRNTPVRDVYAKSGFTSVESDVAQGAGGLYAARPGADLPRVPDYFAVEEAEGADLAEVLANAPAPQPERPAPAAANAPVSPPANGLDPAMAARLETLFRDMFKVDAGISLDTASMESVERWDSLGHLKLAMEIDQTLKVKIPGERLGEIRDFPRLRQAVAEHAA